MKTNELYQQYDTIISTAIKKVWDIGQDNGEIVISETEAIRPFVWEILRIYHQFYSKEIYIKATIFQFWKIKMQHKHIHLKRYSSNKIANLNPVGFIEELSQQFNVDTQIFDDIYYEYYKKG